MTGGTQYQYRPVEGGAFLWQRRQQGSRADVSQLFDLYLLMRCATLTTLVLLFWGKAFDRKASLNTRLWARAGTLSPCEASAGGNNGKHLDLVNITTCRRCSSCWRPDSNRITVIKEKDAAVADSTCLLFFIHTFQTIFSLKILTLTPFFLATITFPFLLPLLWHRDKPIWLQFHVTKKCGWVLHECFINLVTTFNMMMYGTEACVLGHMQWHVLLARLLELVSCA